MITAHADVIGSLLRPPTLRAAQKHFAAGTITATQFKEIEDCAVDEAIAFYSKLFHAEPAKVKAGYANFAIADPPLKLVLLENPGSGGSLNHLGVEVETTTCL